MFQGLLSKHIEKFLDALIRLRRAFHVCTGCYLLRNFEPLRYRYRLLPVFVQLLDGLLVVSKVLFKAYKEVRHSGTEMQDFAYPLESMSASRIKELSHLTCLLLYIVQRVWRVDGKTDGDGMRAGIQ